MPLTEGHAPARAALAGNPSDGYGGAVLAVAVERFGARAQATESDQLRIEPENELVRAAIERLARDREPAVHRTAIRWRTDVPRSVGLGGSSAIIIAALRAAAALHGVEFDAVELARFALAVETEELGIAAGLQDRIAQSFGGLTYMDFAGGGHFEPLAPEQLPPLVLAWRADAHEPSGTVHSDLRSRHEKGERMIVEAMAELAAHARSARDAVHAGDPAALAQAVDASFDVRRRVIALDPRHVEMIDRARASGAAANYTGSGGAIVAVCRDHRHRAEVADALTRLGCSCCVVA
jgi:galactokinase/mevalonate kinase-like predicted kinase